MKINWPHKLSTASEPVCPHCGKGADGYSSTGMDTDRPQHNDLSVCLYCATIGRYQGTGEGMNVAAITDQEIQALAKENPALFEKLLDAVRAIKQKIILR